MKGIDRDTLEVIERIKRLLKDDISSLSNRKTAVAIKNTTLNMRGLDFINASVSAYENGEFKKTW